MNFLKVALCKICQVSLRFSGDLYTGLLHHLANCGSRHTITHFKAALSTLLQV